MKSVLRKLLLPMAVLLAFALIAASCGNDDDGDGDGGAVSTSDGASDDGASDDGASDDGASDDGSTDDGSTDDGAMGDVPENADLDARLRLIGTTPPPQWDPVLTVATCDAPMLAAVYDVLVRNEPDGSLIPGLAESWEAPDPQTFILHLREGVVFSDGTPFDADAVASHIERAQTNELSTLTSLLEVVDSVEVVDDLTVQLNLNAPRAGVMPSIFNGRAGMVASPTEVENPDYGVDNAVGAGPYLYVSHVPDESATLDKNPTSWDADHVYLAGIDHVGSANEFQIERIKDGEVDFTTMKDSDLALAEAAKADGDDDYIITPTVQYGELFIKASEAPFDDIRVRQALNYAIDRTVIADFVTEGGGAPAYGPIPPGSPAKGVSENAYPYDPQKAMDLLAEAGFAEGLDITVAQIEIPYYTRYAAAMQDMLADVGVNVTLMSVVGAEINKALYERQELDAAFTATLGKSEPGLTLETRYSSSGATNPSGLAPEGFDELLAEAFGSGDDAARSELYAQAEQLLMDEAMAVPLYHNAGLSVFRPGVHNIGRGYTTCETGNFLTPSIWIEKEA